MNTETKKLIKGFLETLKDYEVHGGEPNDYKETLVNLRESIKKGIFEETDSNTMKILLNVIKEVNDNITTIDTLMMISSQSPNPDALIKSSHILQSMASLLMNDDKILLLEYLTKPSEK